MKNYSEMSNYEKEVMGVGDYSEGLICVFRSSGMPIHRTIMFESSDNKEILQRWILNYEKRNNT